MSKDILDSIVTSEDLVMIGEAIKTQKHAIESIIEDKNMTEKRTTNLSTSVINCTIGTVSYLHA